MGELEEKEGNGAPTTTDSTPTAEAVDEPKETENLLNKKEEPETPDQPPNNEVKLNGDDPPPKNATEATAVATPAVTQEGREVKPKKIPIGGIKMPGFFTKNKPKEEGDGAEGELLDNAGNEAKQDEEQGVKTTDKTPRPSLLQSLRMLNPFAKRQPLKQEDDEIKEVKVEGANGDHKVATENENDGTTGGDPPPKKGLLNAIRLPITNIIPKKLRPVNGNRDVEMGGPNNKAGLASMETLDDSLKDTDNGKDQTDKAARADDSLETVKLTENNEDVDKEKEKEAAEVATTEKPTFVERIRSYECSNDDWGIFGGILLFFLLVALICAFTFLGKTEITSAPLRDGKYMEAITACGKVEGVMEDSAFAFRGIPYAVPPIGYNRWQPAKSFGNIDECWNGTYKAHNSTTVCMQLFANGSIVGEEDCLQLDVITPHVRYDNPLPVVVLIGTESLNGNSPSILRPSARYARDKDVIFVRPNFRLSAFGFLSIDELSKSAHPPTSGNYALSDIIAALEWIQLNIIHFGGNPKSVTLFGHRAGATLVTALVTSSKANGLFARAWVTSGSGIFPGNPLVESEKENIDYMESMNSSNNTVCKDAECLRNLDAIDVLEAVPDTWRTVAEDLPKVGENTPGRHQWLVLDGDILQKHPGKVLSHDPPQLVIGSTMHASHSDTLHNLKLDWSPLEVQKFINESKIGELQLTDKVFELYSPTYQGLVSLISDIRTVCPLLTLARSNPKISFYVVTQTSGPLNLATVDDDVQAILGRYKSETPEKRRYMSAIQQLFYHYVSHGEIKQFVPQGILEIGQDALPKETYANCDFWIMKDIVPRFARID